MTSFTSLLDELYERHMHNDARRTNTQRAKAQLAGMLLDIAPEPDKQHTSSVPNLFDWDENDDNQAEEVWEPTSLEERRQLFIETLRQLKSGKKLPKKELLSLRRTFSLSHHPDRLPAGQRDEATTQLATVNALIDGALRQQAS